MEGYHKRQEPVEWYASERAGRGDLAEEGTAKSNELAPAPLLYRLKKNGG